MTKKMERLAFAGRLEVKAADTESPEKSFSGYAAVFGNTDFKRDVIAPGAFTKTLEEHKAAGAAPAMFFNHDAFSMPIGIWGALEEDDHGLKAAGQFLDTSAGRDAYTAVKAGAVTGLSIGYFATDFVIEDGVRTILEAKLVEISIVTFPCNTLARVSDVKSADEISEDDFLSKLAELGVEEEDAKALLAKRAKAEDETADDAAEEDAGDAEADTDSEESEEQLSDDSEEEAEAKYMQAAIEAVNNLIREMN